jgi:polyphosphate kinase
MVQQIEDGYNEAGPDGTDSGAEARRFWPLTHEFVDDQYDCWNNAAPGAGGASGIRVLGLHELDARRAAVRR